MSHTPGNSSNTWQRPLMVFWVTSFFALMGGSVLGPIYPFFLSTLGLKDPAEVNRWTGYMWAAVLFPTVISMPFWGMIGDKFGHKKMVMRAMFGAGAMVFLTGIVTNIHQLLAVRIVHGCFGGFLMACQAYMSRITPRERVGHVFGVLQTAGLTAMTVGPVFGGVLVQYLGFTRMFIITGIVHWIAGLAVFFLIEPDKPELGIRTPISFIKPLRSVLRSSKVRLMAGIRLLIDGTSALFFPLLPLFIQQVIGSATPDTTRIGFAYSVTGVATIIGAALIGRLGDRTNHKWTLTTCVLACSLLYIAHGLLSTFPQLVVIRFLTGFFSAGILPSVMAIVVMHTSSAERGVTIATVSSLCSLGAAFTTFFGGILVNAVGFRWVFYGVSASLFIAWIISTVFIKREETFAHSAQQAAGQE